MRAVLDACVLFPSVVRKILIATARADKFTPLWSARILDEWTHSVASRLGPEAGLEAEGARALLNAFWPDAGVPQAPDLEATLWLPDPADTHVLATAITGAADLIVTFNLRDFPVNMLREHRISAVHPDAFLLGLAHADRDQLTAVADAVLAEANALRREPVTRLKLLKKAGLPRFAKFLLS